MDRFKKILFYADGSRGEKSALGNAMDLAESNNASLTVLDVVAEVSSNDARLAPTIGRLQQAVIKERYDELDEIVIDLKQSRNPRHIEVRVIPARKDFIEVIKEVVTDDYDLLVKAADRASAIASHVFGSTDLRFMRQCPCPVWIIKSGHRRVGTVLAAVDVSDDSAVTLDMADRIINIATGVAVLVNARVHVLSVREQAINSKIAHRMDSRIFKDLNAGHRHMIKARFEKLIDRYTDRDICQHLISGNPHRVITKFADDYDVDLIVMGTLSSTETPGLLIGNTAERVIHSVDCSVLTLKPEDFTTIIAQHP